MNTGLCVRQSCAHKGEEVKGDIISNGSWDSVLSYWDYYFCVGDQSIKMLLGLGFFFRKQNKLIN